MSSPARDSNDGPSSAPSGDVNNPSTVAAFSPPTLSNSASGHTIKQRSTILVHQKSPLLVATPPQITRALAYSHPFIQALNKLAGLLSWTSGDPWESYLMVAAFWGITLYADVVLRWVGPLVMVVGVILGMYSRRYSPLSSTATTGEKGQKTHKRLDSESMRQHKSLDEIVDTLKLFTSRCNILLDPFLSLTDFLSTQRTATSATTRPALTTLFIRILLVTPFWILLTLPPLYILTTKRMVLFFGTVVLSWHSRPARVTRTILWRSRLVRRSTAIITGLDVADPAYKANGDKANDGRPALPPRKRKSAHDIAASLATKRKPSSSGIRFTFILFENQRRWLGIGWTSSMLAYERGAWSDEHLNSSVPKDSFQLPEVEGGHARWRWVEGSEWHIEGAEGKSLKDESADDGWIYYDNKWRDGRRGKDGWGRYTRRRKWCRDAELVEITPSTDITPSPTPSSISISEHETLDGTDDNTTLAESTATIQAPPSSVGASTAVEDDTDGVSVNTAKSRKRWFRRSSQAASQKSVANSNNGTGSSVGSSLKSYPDEDDVHRGYQQSWQREENWGLGEDANMQLS
ncbi:Pex24p-domain-containing protein [Tothia fuscella]|uniref:Pex24p-domain-containing protein n=1 Tax=Tothia fuscella TaxID=1048955 RepID=A0A9P4U0G4_9PEZI|nr:Pex24p-domain-containing protein [Tothia fuscella]